MDDEPEAVGARQQHQEEGEESTENGYVIILTQCLNGRWHVINGMGRDTNSNVGSQCAPNERIRGNLSEAGTGPTKNYPPEREFGLYCETN